MTGVLAEPPHVAAESGRSRPRTLLITGIGSSLARRVAERVDGDPVFGRILGVDAAPVDAAPKGRLETAVFDPFGAGLEDFLRAERVEAIAHLLWLPDALDPAAAWRLNVGGTMRLVGAALRAGVRAFLFRSSTAVYGASPRNPCFIPEDAPLAPSPSDLRARHLAEVELYLRGVLSRRPDVEVAVLRLAPILGGRAGEGRLAAYLAPRVVPTALGYDPRLQVLEEDDAAEAIAQALRTRFQGEANVAAPGVVPLHRALRLLGRTAVPVPHPLLPAALAVHALRGGRPHLRLPADALRFPPVGDAARMERALGVRPRRDALEAIRGLAAEAPERDDAGEGRRARAELARVRALLARARTGPR